MNGHPDGTPERHPELDGLLEEYERALDHTDRLWTDLPAGDVTWRPHEHASAIGWHLGHQAAVAHFMLRNLTAAEPSPDPPLDGTFDSATPEPERGDLPDLERLARYRAAVAGRVRFRLGEISAGRTGAPDQLRVVGVVVLRAIINHEYQHDQWIAEVRHDQLGHPLPAPPVSSRLRSIDGYLVVV